MMHSALLPTYEQFLPRETARRKSQMTMRSWRSRLRRQSPLAFAKQIFIFLAIVTIIVKFWFVPRRYHAALIAEENEHIAGLFPTSKDITKAWGPGVELYDFSQQTASMVGASTKKERLLLCMPLRNAEPVLDLMLQHLHNLSYPHSLIDLAFLVSDSTDDTYAKLSEKVKAIQGGKDSEWSAESLFNRVDLYRHDFGATIGQGVDQRHGVAVQAERRKLMGRARNWLLSAALRPEHSWVYWRDADIEKSPDTIIEDLMKHDKDVIVPNVWRPLPKWLGGQQPYDLNSWQESDAALDLASTLHVDDVIVEGYAEYATWRVHLAYLRNEDGSGDMDEIIDLDGVGGVSILAKARVFRAGVNFPGYSFMNHAETEGFGKMARQMRFSVAGLVQYTVWHKYEPSDDDIAKMKEMEAMGLSID